MQLDIRTLLFLYIVVIVVVTVVVAFHRATRRTYDGATQWVACNALIASGFMALALRGAIPDLLSMYGASFAIPAAMVMRLDAIHRFLGGRPMHRLWYVYPFLLAAGFFAIYVAYDGPLHRALLFSLGSAIPSVAAALEFARHRARRDPLFIANTVVLVALALLLLMRAVVLAAEGQYSLLAPSTVHALIIIGGMSLEVAWNLLFLSLHMQRLEQELKSGEERLAGKVVELERAMEEVQTLRGLLPICAHCHKIRGEAGSWERLESYISTRTSAQFSHGLCPDCARTLYPTLRR